ncbi:hypothetical protein [Paraburkholderia domus]|uniref:hypothetical protein n=1 Tax=Paraburkholderia domus TaxID=2793075 RepID=UPI001912533B|nr:hypothetical protein [Paraburkholderia domus]MBK5058918.1 hypothetical protein [Burkholderia sp. R-70199]CAE6880310.1 hypothetical protein R70199_02488 [Paraburkholderia domus]
MKTKTKTFQGKEATDAGSNIFHFPAADAAVQARNLSARQNAVREHLTSITCANDSTAPVAIAIATVLPDGTIEFSATGIERDFAAPTADALDRLSTILRFHAVKPRRIDRFQQGLATIAPMVSLAFMVATYVNTIAWLDSALMLASQLSVSWLLNRSRKSASK